MQSEFADGLFRRNEFDEDAKNAVYGDTFFHNPNIMDAGIY